MNTRVARLLALIHTLEGDLEVELARGRIDFCYTVENRKIRFEEQILQRHRKIRSHWLSYILDARPAVILTAPIIYSTAIAFALLDAMISLYQWACFGVYGIARVRRADHLVFDRNQLSYLNGLERFNCLFCSYGNGVISYAREIAARTEQYWCPIKHSRRILGAHERYHAFADYGDAATYASVLANLRKQLQEEAPPAASES
jgi:hypothetical protein